MTYRQILDKLEKRDFAPVYLLHGEEPFYIDKISNCLENNILREDEKDMNQTVLYGKDTDVAMVDSVARSYPFCADYRVVIVKEAKDLKGIAKLHSYVENPSPSTVLVLCYKYGKADKKLADACAKHGVVFVSDPVRDYQLSKWVMEQVSAHNLRINPDGASMMADFIGNNLSRIDNELEKLRMILGDNQLVTVEAIQKNIGITKEYNIFELIDAIGERNETKAFKITLNFCQHQTENPNVRTIEMLSQFFLKLLTYNYAYDRSDEARKSIFGTSADFIIRKNVAYAQKYSTSELKRIIATLREYDLKSKGVDNAADPAELLKEMIYKILH